MTICINEAAEPTTVELDDFYDWEEFALANRDDLEEQYGSLTQAQRHLLDGGLMMGGGAAPAVHVYFVEE